MYDHANLFDMAIPMGLIMFEDQMVPLSDMAQTGSLLKYDITFAAILIVLVAVVALRLLNRHKRYQPTNAPQAEVTVA